MANEMNVTMVLELHYGGGLGVLEKEIIYYGESLDEIARIVDNDNNELLQYMLTNDDKGQKAFCFGGFMFNKKGLVAAQMKEPDVQF